VYDDWKKVVPNCKSNIMSGDSVKKIISIAGIVLKLFFRSGSAWGLIGMTVLLSVFMFFATNSDNLLVNELHLRIKYSLYAFTVLLNIALIYFSCVTLRKDIDERRFHTIAAAPVHRGEIWLGKFFGLLSLALIVFVSASIAIAMSCLVFVMQWENRDDIASLKTEFFRTYYVCNPDLTSFEKEVSETYAKARKALDAQHAAKEKAESGETGHHHDHGDLEGEKWKSRKYLLDEVKKQKQMIAPDSTGRWMFNWDDSVVNGDYVLLRFKFYSNRRRSKVTGEWSFKGNNKWKYEFSGYPFLTHEIKIPVDVLKGSKKLELVYTPKSSSYIIFPVYKGGITLLYDSGCLMKNYILLVIFSLFHMSALIAVSLMFSSLFSYSVAVFIATATYIIGAFSSFFQNVLRDLSFHDPTIMNQIFSKIIAFGMWVTEGTKTFPVNSMFADGISIPFISLMKSAGFSLIIYLIAVACIGIFALTKKEIDKILQR
jgi:hypothetical protein